MIIYPDPAGGEKKEGGVRPPPQPPITVRTMDSDIKSMQESGGGVPQEEVLNTPRPPVRPEPPKPSDDDLKVKIPGYSGPEKGVFSSISLPTADRGVDLPGPGTVPPPVNHDGSSAGKIIALIVTIVVAALIGVGLYFYVYPLLLSSDNSPSPTPIVIAQTPTAQTPAPSEQPINHTKRINSDKTEDVSALTSASPETVSAGKTILKEIFIKKDGVVVKFSDLFSAMIPELTAQDIQSSFEDDYTAFVYYDENGGWPGFILKRKQEVTAFSAQNTFRKIEASKSLGNIFMTNPGASQGEFKNGNYKGLETHYLVFEKKGAAINYAWSNDLLLITTTFPALKNLIDGTLITK